MQTIDDLLRQTTSRYDKRSEHRKRTERLIKDQGVLAANDPDLVARRLSRLHADPQLVEQLGDMKRSFRSTGPGVSPQDFPRSLERVLGTNDLIGIRFLEQGIQVAKAVARVQIRDDRGRPAGYGSGFLVSPRLFLTNNHVLTTPASAAASQAEFNFQANAGGEMQPSQVFAFAPEDFFLTDLELDYTLVALRQDPRLTAYGWLQLIPQTGKLIVGETVNIIQHPNGEPKQLAIRNNHVVDELELFLHYKTDTAPGSSGAPVFNDQWEVVGLHHSGVPTRSAEGRILAIDGREWEEWMGEQRVAWIANEGVRVSRLVAHVQAQDLSANSRRLVAEMLDAIPPQSPGTPSGPSAPVSPTSEAVPPGVGVPAVGVSTWTIPLQVSVSFGPASLTLPALPGEGSISVGAGQVAAGKRAGEEPAAGNEELFGWGRPPQPPAAGLIAAPFSLASLKRDRFSWEAALSLALASQLAYEAAAAVQTRTRAWGFDRCEAISSGPAQGFVAGTEDLVLVSFRGTESVADWLSNLKVVSKESGRFGPVHAGFLEQFQSLQQKIEALLQTAPDRRLVITGHSLGGAIAALAAATWVGKQPLHSLYTYGQPMVGKAEFTTYVQRQFADRYYRFVNDADVVPRVPPGYRHAGQLYQFDSRGRLSAQPALTGARESTTGSSAASSSPSTATSKESLPLTAAEFRDLQARLRSGGEGTAAKEGFTTLISDHMIPEYITKIQKQLPT